MKLRDVLLPATMAAMLCLPAVGAPNAGTGAIWRIGTFDRSSGEFALGQTEASGYICRRQE